MNKRVFTAFVVLSFVALLSCCPQQQPVNPHPSQDVQELTQRIVWQWLDFSLEPDTWDSFSSIHAAWRHAVSLTDLHRYFESFGPDYMVVSFDTMVEQLKTTELYKSADITPQELFKMVMEALTRYVWIE